MNFLLDIDLASRTNDFGEKIAFGATTLLIGLLAVFSVLIIIWLCLVLLKICLQGFSSNKKTESAKAPVQVVTQAPTASKDEEIIVAIAAAIAAAESESSGLKFRVVSFRRK